jgi:hypothetical protein
VRRKDFKLSSNSYLCSSHFIESDYNKAIVSGKLVLKKMCCTNYISFSRSLDTKSKREEFF